MLTSFAQARLAAARFSHVDLSKISTEAYEGRTGWWIPPNDSDPEGTRGYFVSKDGVVTLKGWGERHEIDKFLDDEQAIPVRI